MLRHIIVEGFSGLKRAKFSSTISIFTITITLVIISVFVKIAMNATSILEEVKSRFTIEFFISDAITSSELKLLKERLKKDSLVHSIQYISKARAAVIFEEEFGENIVSVLGVNPLPQSFKLKVKSQYVHLDSIEKFIDRSHSFPKVVDRRYNIKFVKGLQRGSEFLTTAGLGLGALLILASLSLVSNTTRLTIYARRDMIKTMLLVGARYSYIVFPFLLEGCLQGIIAGCLAACAFFTSRLAFDSYYSTIQVLPSESDYLIYVLVLGLGIILGLLGSLLSIRKFIKL